MATKTQIKKQAPRAEKKQAAKPEAEAQTDSPQAPLYKASDKMPPVRPGTHRAYAQEIARNMTKAKPDGFTLAEFREELIKRADSSTITPPKGGWQSHNMPTWMAHEKQGWLVRADSA